MREIKTWWASDTGNKSWPEKFSIHFPNSNDAYTFPNFKIYIVQTKDGIWTSLDADNYELLQNANIDPSDLTKEELDLCLLLLKA